MDVDRKTPITSTGASPVHSSCPKPEASPSENHSSSSSDSPDNLSFRHGFVIPNRVYVGGSEHKVSESELQHIFSQYGTVSGVNIVYNRYRLTNWYAFVTFEKPEDAQKLLLHGNGIYFKGRRLSIRHAIHRQHKTRGLNYSVSSVEPVYRTTSSGFSYTFHNGVAYFHSPQASPNPHQWTPQSAPVMVPQPYQPVYHQPAYHNYQPWYFQNHYQWNSIESPMHSGPMMYAHQPPMDDSNESHMYSSFPVPPPPYSSFPVPPPPHSSFPVPPPPYSSFPVPPPPHSSFPVPPPPPPAAVVYSYFSERACPPELAEAELHGPQAVLQ